MKKALVLALAGVSCVALLLGSCSAEGNTTNTVNPALSSTLSSNTESAVSDANLFTSDGALALIQDKLDPEENYSAKVSGSTLLVDGHTVYIVVVSLDDTVLAPTAAVDAASGELFSYHEDKTLGDSSELPYLMKSARADGWNGVFLLDDNAATASFTPIDAHSFEFMLESNANGITSTLSGIAQMDEASLLHYIGEDGLGLIFELNEDGTELTIRISDENTAVGATSYTGTYLRHE